MTEQETETEVDILTAALGYAALGWSVFPVQGKRPIEVAPGVRLTWSELSTTDPEVLVGWFAGTEGLGIGVDMAKSGLVAIDGDNIDKMPEDLREAFQAELKRLLEENQGASPGGGPEE